MIASDTHKPCAGRSRAVAILSVTNIVRPSALGKAGQSGFQSRFAVKSCIATVK